MDDAAGGVLYIVGDFGVSWLFVLPLLFPVSSYPRRAALSITHNFADLNADGFLEKLSVWNPL
jgi:hypothetical protein